MCVCVRAQGLDISFSVYESLSSRVFLFLSLETRQESLRNRFHIWVEEGGIIIPRFVIFRVFSLARELKYKLLRKFIPIKRTFRATGMIIVSLCGGRFSFKRKRAFIRRELNVS